MARMVTPRAKAERGADPQPMAPVHKSCITARPDDSPGMAILSWMKFSRVWENYFVASVRLRLTPRLHQDNQMCPSLELWCQITISVRSGCIACQCVVHRASMHSRYT